MNLDVDFEPPTSLPADYRPSETSEPEVGKSGVWLVASAFVVLLLGVGWVIGGINKGDELKPLSLESKGPSKSPLVANLPERVSFSNGFITITLTDEEEVWLRNGALKINVKSKSDPK